MPRRKERFMKLNKLPFVIYSLLLSMSSFASADFSERESCRNEQGEEIAFESFAGNADVRIMKTYFGWNSEAPDSTYVRTNTVHKPAKRSNERVETYTLLKSIFTNIPPEVTVIVRPSSAIGNRRIILGSTNYLCLPERR